MKTTIISGLLLLSALTTHATPVLVEQSSDAFFRALPHLDFFDEARVIPYTDENGNQINPHGFVSLFGILNGGTFFNTDLFSLGETANASIWWDFSSINYRMKMIDVFGVDAQGNGWESFYAVGQHYRFTGSSPVTLNNNVPIGGIAFYGLSPDNIPETGSGFTLLSIALVALAPFLVRKL